MLALLIGAATATHDLRAQQDAQPPTFRTEANYVRVDVFPMANGAPVLDLLREDFEVFEDGAPQRIDAFDHVIIRGPEPQTPRVEPRTVAESRAMLENPRARVFVIFLDTRHVDLTAAKSIRQPLINFLNRAIGPEDLVGVMTPGMSGADVTFARRMETIEGFLTRYWWGERDRLNTEDPLENLYKQCYPGFPPSPDDGPRNDTRGIADEMIRRFRERETLTTLENLVRYLRTLREERKAIITITDGWLLYRPDSALGRPLDNAPQLPRAGIDPNGRLVTSGQRAVSPYDDCERDRQRLAMLDSPNWIREIYDLANRANASFYPVDPRGLSVFDTSLGEPRTGAPARGTTTIVPPSVDSAMLRARDSSLRELALTTDGLAILGSNDLEGGLRRVTADLSSYYLLAYYSTGKFDGKFHSISVRVKRQGVQVRARRGYLAPTLEEVKASTPTLTTTPAASATPASTDAREIDAALTKLGGLGRELPLRMQATVGWAAGDRASITVVGEMGSGEEWKAGGDVDLMIVASSGDTIATARAQVAPGTRGFRAMMTPTDGSTAREYMVRVRARSRTAGVAPLNESVRVEMPVFPAPGGAVLIRRGQTTGGREVPTADARFRRTEELRVEIPTPSSEPLVARLLDRSGKPLPLPIAFTVRDDPDGVRWQTGRLTLAPLAAGDYVIEVAGGGGADTPPARTLIAFRVIP